MRSLPSIESLKSSIHQTWKGNLNLYSEFIQVFELPTITNSFVASWKVYFDLSNASHVSLARLKKWKAYFELLPYFLLFLFFFLLFFLLLVHPSLFFLILLLLFSTGWSESTLPGLNVAVKLISWELSYPKLTKNYMWWKKTSPSEIKATYSKLQCGCYRWSKQPFPLYYISNLEHLSSGGQYARKGYLTLQVCIQTSLS